MQLDQAERVQSWLESLPARLQALAESAAQQAGELQRQHGFSLAGLSQLRGAPASSQAEPPPPQDDRPWPDAALTGSLVIANGLPAPGPMARREQQQRHASEVLQRFKNKLFGGDGEGGSRPSAAEQVDRLIAAATSPARLARMYEGWMPWV